MEKIILVVWLLTSRSEISIQYTAEFPTEEACQKVAATMQDTRTGFSRSYPIKHAECTIKVKPKGGA